jgi:hypothetical protein
MQFRTLSEYEALISHMADISDIVYLEVGGHIVQECVTLRDGGIVAPEVATLVDHVEGLLAGVDRHDVGLELHLVFGVPQDLAELELAGLGGCRHDFAPACQNNMGHDNFSTGSGFLLLRPAISHLPPVAHPLPQELPAPLPRASQDDRRGLQSRQLSPPHQSPWSSPRLSPGCRTRAARMGCLAFWCSRMRLTRSRTTIVMKACRSSREDLPAHFWRSVRLVARAAWIPAWLVIRPAAARAVRWPPPSPYCS